MLGAIGAVSIATPFLHVQYTQRWFAWPNIILTAPVRSRSPRHRAAAAQPRQQNRLQPFFLSWRCSRCPMRIGHQHVSLYRAAEHQRSWQAASPANSQLFMLFGVAVADPADPRLYRLGLLGVPRQGHARKRLSLMPSESTPSEPTPRPLTRRLLWFAALWLGGRHGRADLVWPAALDCAEMTPWPQSPAIVTNENRRHSSEIPAPPPKLAIKLALRFDGFNDLA